MAPAGTPWDGLYWVFPGSVYQGPAPTYLLLIGSYVGYGLVSLTAFFFFMHATVTQKTSNLFALINFLGGLASLITAAGPLLGFIPSPIIYYGDRTAENGPTLYDYPHPAATYFTAMLVFGFPLHSIALTCRLVYDAQGPSAGGFLAPFAAAMQLWAILPIVAGGHLPIYWFIVLVTYFGQLMSTMMHWMLRACDAGRCGRKGGDRVKAKRLWYGFAASLLQFVGFMPIYFYLIANDSNREGLSTGGLICCYLVQIIFEMASHICWIRVGVLTPAERKKKSRKYSPDANAHVDLAEAQYEARVGLPDVDGYPPKQRILRDPYVPADTRLASPEMGYSAAV